jgi:hypothetical protein
MENAGLASNVLAKIIEVNFLGNQAKFYQFLLVLSVI